MSTATEQRVYGILRTMPCDGLAAAKLLFWSELNFDHVNERLFILE